MTNPKEKPENQPASQPAGEAPGSDLTPEGQGGPHLPDISEPTSKSLAEQFESGPTTVEQPDPFGGGPIDRPVEQLPAHHPVVKEAVLREQPDPFGGGPIDRPVEQPHGTEVLTTDPPHRCSICNGPNHQACGCEARARIKGEKPGSRMDRELTRDEVLEKICNAGTDIDPNIMIQMASAAGSKFAEDMQNVLDQLSDINTNLETLVKLQTDRAALLKVILDGSRN